MTSQIYPQLHTLSIVRYFKQHLIHCIIKTIFKNICIHYTSLILQLYEETFMFLWITILTEFACSPVNDRIYQQNKNDWTVKRCISPNEPCFPCAPLKRNKKLICLMSSQYIFLFLFLLFLFILFIYLFLAVRNIQKRKLNEQIIESRSYSNITILLTMKIFGLE